MSRMIRSFASMARATLRIGQVQQQGAGAYVLQDEDILALVLTREEVQAADDALVQRAA